MARLEVFDDVPQVNLSASVGKKGVNDPRDVLAVQALLKYAFDGERGWKETVFPEPTGAFCDATRLIIKRYQRVIKRMQPAANVDGRIDPARGNYPSGSRVVWTILALNTDAMTAWLLNRGKRVGRNYIHAMSTLYTGFRDAVGDRGVGTLNLELEGGGLGSLDLELE